MSQSNESTRLLDIEQNKPSSQLPKRERERDLEPLSTFERSLSSSLSCLNLFSSTHEKSSTMTSSSSSSSSSTSLLKIISLGSLALFFSLSLYVIFNTDTKESQFPPSSSLPLHIPFESNMTLRWGIVGLGRISSDFAVALYIAGANLTAVAAGSLPHSHKRAIEFGEKFNLPKSKCYGTYEELAADPNVDIVYIGNTNQLHYNTALLMMDRGKHVLVEKPTAMTVQETKHMISAARSKVEFISSLPPLNSHLPGSVFFNKLLEYFPAIKYAKEQMEAGCIGEIVGVRGDFGFQAQPNPNDRYFNPITGGGALMDMGCYLIQFGTLAHKSVMTYKHFLKDSLLSTRKLAEEDAHSTQPFEFSSLLPDEIKGNGLVGGDGVDIETAFILRWKSQSFSRSLSQVTEEVDNFPDRRLSSPPAIGMIQSTQNDELNFKGITGIFSTSLRRGSPFTVEIMGTHGFINIRDPANCPTSSVVNLGPDAYAASGGSTFQFPTQPVCQKNGIGPNFFSEPLPDRPSQFGSQQYPGTPGFVYVIRAVQDCITGKGAYSSSGSDYPMKCLEMPELPSDEQIIIMEVVESIRKDIGADQD